MIGFALALALSLRVVDGDTVDATYPVPECGCDRGTVRHRLIGYDTPETHRPQCERERAMGHAAKGALRALIDTAGTVEIIEDGKDRYGRSLAVMLIDGVPVGDLLMGAGFARPYDGGRRGGWCRG